MTRTDYETEEIIKKAQFAGEEAKAYFARN
jgi:hypothetical protein